MFEVLVRPSDPDPEQVHTTGSFRVPSCNPKQKPFVAVFSVPLEVEHGWWQRSLNLLPRN